MTKTAMRIAERYSEYYKAWLRAYKERAEYNKQMKLLLSVELLETILVNDCNLGHSGIAKLREKVIDEYFADLAK